MLTSQPRRNRHNTLRGKCHIQAHLGIAHNAAQAHLILAQETSERQQMDPNPWDFHRWPSRRMEDVPYINLRKISQHAVGLIDEKHGFLWNWSNHSPQNKQGQPQVSLKEVSTSHPAARILTRVVGGLHQPCMPSQFDLTFGHWLSWHP
jgi:hypothetical protein